jgi:hypothetical protein
VSSFASTRVITVFTGGVTAFRQSSRVVEKL